MRRELTYTPLADALLTVSRALGDKSQTESVSVREAFEWVLAVDIVAREDLPKRDVSHFDGFAIASTDTAGATTQQPVWLTVKPGRSTRVGLLPKGALKAGQALRVATGGYIPEGADAVVPVEEASLEARRIGVRRRFEKGERVYPAGSDVRKGDLILRAGRTLMGQDLVLLASLHFEKVIAFKRPRVAVVPTGSELTPKIRDKSGRVVESHSLLLKHVIEGAGGEPVLCPIVPDERTAVSRALKQALRRSEIVLTLAGSSIGEPDLVDSAIRGFGQSTTALVHGIRVNRGRVMGVAVVKGKPVVILPGPIQGALNAFIVLGYPLIRYHLGAGLEAPPSVKATVGEDWEATGKFRDFDQVVYLKLTKDPAVPTGLVASPATAQTEKVSFLVSNDAYAMVPGKNPALKRGDTVEAHLLPGFSRLE